MKEPTNFTLDGPERYGSIAISCEYDGKRYHAWLDREKLQPNNGGTLYQNSGKKIGNVRHLDQAGATGRKLMPIMLAKAQELKPDFDQRCAAKIAEQEREQAEAKRVYLIREAAQELFAACELAFPHLQAAYDHGSLPFVVLETAHKAIAKAKGLGAE